MFLLRVIIIVVIIMALIPVFNKTKNYVLNKIEEGKVLTETAKKAIKYQKNQKK
jgi:uncharacterized membrane protein YqiK